MTQITHTVTINRAPEAVWTYISDFPRGPEWIPGQLEKRAITPEPFGLGTRIKAVQKVPGRTVEATFEIGEWQPARRLVERSIDSPLQVQVVYELAPVPDGTKLTITYDIAGRGLQKVVELLTARSIRTSLPQACATLKHNIEAAKA
jgi:uncharacterized membrane protein